MIGKEPPKFDFVVFMFMVGLVVIGILLVPLFNDNALHSISSFNSQFIDYDPEKEIKLLFDFLNY